MPFKDLIPTILKTKFNQIFGKIPLVNQYRRLTSASRMLPEFLVIGVVKGGTSSFYANLVRHPEIVSASTKEIHYFDRNYDKGLSWYQAHFPLKKRPSRHFITGEATPSYIIYFDAPVRIKALNPRMKLIVLLRNPIDRAYSNYHMRGQKWGYRLSFEETVREEFDHLVHPEKSYKGEAYLIRSVYVDQLKVWFQHFPREQFCILKSEDYYTDPLATLKNVTKNFLGLSDWEPKHYRENPNQGRKYPKLDPKLRTELAAFFEPYNQALYELLGQDFGWQ